MNVQHLLHGILQNHLLGWDEGRGFRRTQPIQQIAANQRHQQTRQH